MPPDANSLYNDIMADLLTFQLRRRNTRWRPPRKRYTIEYKQPLGKHAEILPLPNKVVEEEAPNAGVAYFSLSSSAFFTVYTGQPSLNANFPSRKSVTGSVFQLKLLTWKWENPTSVAKGNAARVLLEHIITAFLQMSLSS